MKYQRGYQYALRLSGAQRKFMNNEFGACRFVYNKLLEQSLKEYELFKEGKGDKPNVSAYALTKKLPALKQEFPFLKEVSAVALQKSAMRLGTAYKHFFDRIKKKDPKAGFPKFKSKRDKQSLKLVDLDVCFKLVSVKYARGEAIALKYPKLDTPIRILWDRELPSDPKSVTVSRDKSGNYFATFVCEREPNLKNGQGKVGLDMGIKDLVVCSDESKIENMRFLIASQKRLARAQKKLSKKKKGSNNRSKQRIIVAKIHKRIVNQRKDYIHKFTTKLVSDNQVIGIELLKVAGMMKNRKLSKHITDAAWGEIKQQLLYKSEESGNCKVIFYPSFFPSTQVCSSCFHRLESENKLSLKDREWECPQCHTKHDRDINAAKVVLEGALSALELTDPEKIPQCGGMIIEGSVRFEELIQGNLKAA